MTMSTETTEQATQPVLPADSLADETPATQPETAPAASESETPVQCAACEAPAVLVCYRCKADLCQAHSYREENGTRDYCRACADALVGVCDVCDALYAKACRECGMKVCQDHQKRVVERWGWGGLPGQGGVTSWFPMIRTYCQEHGQNRFDVPKPDLKSMAGYDGSSLEW
jgi:hypothetical protein